MMKRIGFLFFLMANGLVQAQSPWPSESWNNAAALTSVMNAGGLLELSGLHWNSETNRLYVVHGDGRLRVLQYNPGSDSFSQIGNKTISGGPEGITQGANLGANEFYTIDENNYEIRKYTHNTTFSTVTESKHWDLLQSPSPMEDTGNTGPEGIAFVPDANLSAIGFVSPVTGLPYTSVKGAGGLFFIAHQDEGYIWVFDLNPNVNNDFAFVGKIKSNRSESCDLAFDRSTGLLYILHNVGANYLEVTDLSLAPVSETKFTTVNEYFMANPGDGNVNIEGFAVMPKCNTAVSGSAFLCRDVESNESTSIAQDAIRWFNPFAADGTCVPLSNEQFDADSLLLVSPNPGNGNFELSGNLPATFSIRLTDTAGKIIWDKPNNSQRIFETAALQNGVYFISIIADGKTTTTRWVKK
ncbi:T9SS type A sorting domain-containing protein [Flavobacterium sp.]|uniref:T9SS type A sorting domain-containing protein n=1 Tax=Flavobacterium sp. TaxID=239 RepID=UPI0039E456F4